MKPHIPVPCSEDWSKMKIGQMSRHCESCHKNVMDFTKMSRHEILTYLIENREKETCGRVLPSQLDYRHEEILVTIQALEKKHRNTNLSYYLLTMATLSLLSCEAQPTSVKKPIKTEQTCTGDTLKPKSQRPPVLGKIRMPVEEKTVMEQMQVMGMMIAVPPVIDTIRPPDEEGMLGEIAIDEKPRMIAATMPEFIGGTDALMKYIKNQLQYPEWERKKEIEGTVYATFVIETDGSVQKIQILRSVEGAKNFDKEVERILSTMPKWKPGMENGQPVPVQFNLPFRFQL